MKYFNLLFLLLAIQTPFLLGNDWVHQSPFPQGNILRDIHLFDEDKMIAVGDAGTIVRTTDGGLTWDVKNYNGEDGTEVDLQAVHFINANTGWIVGMDGLILNTTDGGNTWSKQESGLRFNDLFGVYFVNSQSGWAVANGGIILKTTDGGQNWTHKITGTGALLFDIFFINDLKRLVHR